MSGNSYIKTCPKCGAANILRGKAMTLAMTCSSCAHYFEIGSWRKPTLQFQYSERVAIPIGAKGKFDGYTYEVMGFVVKQETKHNYRWREYLIFSPFRGYAFLSEYNGHWNIVWPIEGEPARIATESEFYHNNSYFKLYQHYAAEVVYAQGEFFFDVVGMTSSTSNAEYIAPPYLLASEKSDDSILWCEGEYLTPHEIASAFSMSVNDLPSKSGIGYTQPFHQKFSDTALTTFTLLAVIFLILIQVILSSTADDKVIFHADYESDNLKEQKMIATPRFKLEGVKSLEVEVFSYLTNDWFFSEFTLVNEDDGTEYNFSKDIEYYEGYEDGTSWTEGSRTGTAFLSKVPEGNYHLNIYPEFSLGRGAFSVYVRHDVPSSTNLIFALLALIPFPLYHFIRKGHHERARWEDSEYSPYHNETE